MTSAPILGNPPTPIARRRDNPQAASGAIMLAVCVGMAATVLGTAGSFGVLLDDVATSFSIDYAQAVLLLSAATAVQFGLSPTAGWVADRASPAELVLAAGLAGTAGLVGVACAPTFQLAVAAYGIGMGTASASVLTPLIATVSRQIRRRRTVSLGILASAAGLGTVVLAPITGMLVDRCGLRLTWLLNAALVAAAGVVGSAVLRPQERRAASPAGHRRNAVPPVGFRTVLGAATYRRYFLCSALTSAPVYLPAAFLTSSAVANGIAPARAGLLLSVLALSGVATRVILPFVLPRRWHFPALRIAHVSMATGMLLWASSSSLPALMAFACLHGVSLGAWSALEDLLIIHTAPRQNLGEVLGLMFLAPSGGVLFGPTAAAAFIEMSGYTPVLVTAAAILLGAVSCCVPSSDYPPHVHTRDRPADRVPGARSGGLSSRQTRPPDPNHSRKKRVPAVPCTR